MSNPDKDNKLHAGRAGWKIWAPGILFSMGLGLALLLLADTWETFGYGLVLGVPLAIGLSLGYLIRLRTAWLICLAAAVLIGLVAIGLTLDLAGLLCALILATIVVVPLMLALVLGFYARRLLNRRRKDRYQYLPLVVLFIHAGGWMFLEHRFPPRLPPESVETTRLFQVPPEKVWESLLFYEEVPLPPPALALIGLPYPEGTEGSMRAVGDVKTCRYSTGYLKKEITALEWGRRLEFSVIEQKGIEDRSIRLLEGSFRLEQEAPGQTRVSLMTQYQPLLSARIFWRPFEHRLARILHWHVLDGMELSLEQSR